MVSVTRALIEPRPIRKSKRMGYFLDWIGGVALAVMIAAWMVAT